VATNAGQPLNQEGRLMTWLALAVAFISFAIIVGAIVPDSISMKRRIIELEEQQKVLKRKVARLNENNFS